MKQKTKQLIMTLVALLALTTHAWAKDPTVYDRGDVELSSLQVGDILMPGVNLTKGNSSADAYLYGNRYSINEEIRTMTFRISSYPFSIGLNGLMKAYLAGNGPYNCMPITEDGKVGNAWVVTSISGSDIRIGGTIYPKPTPFAITWSAATPNTASIDKMPAGNVTVSVEYFPQAEFAKSTDATLAPTAIADVPANTDAPIVTAGTVANIGTSEVPQGTLKYFVKQSDGNTAPTAPDYDTEGWTDKVPTANGLAQGDVYVWYYIKGAEPANVADRTDDNTRSDSDIKPLGTSGYVTIAAEPTYYVSLNKTGMAEGEPAKWSAKSTNVTTAVNLGEADLEGVKKGETVTVTYTGSKKVIGVKAEKKKAPAETTVTLTTGEIGDLFSWDSNSKTINGITIAVSGDACFHSTGLIDVHGDTGPEPDPDQVYAVGTFTFTSSAGKIKRIDINHNNGGLWYGAGEGWPGSYQVYDNSTFTWSGIPAASVTLNGSHKGFENCALSDVSSIVFTLEPTN